MAGVVICCEDICDSLGPRFLECGPFPFIPFNLIPGLSKSLQRARVGFRHFPINRLIQSRLVPLQSCPAQCREWS